jgi:hypothetical protein
MVCSSDGWMASVAATHHSSDEWMTSRSVVAGTSSSDGRLMLWCPSLLDVTAATGNLKSDYQLLLDRYMFIRHSQIQIDTAGQIQVYKTEID